MIRAISLSQVFDFEPNVSQNSRKRAGWYIARTVYGNRCCPAIGMTQHEMRPAGSRYDETHALESREEMLAAQGSLKPFGAQS